MTKTALRQRTVKTSPVHQKKTAEKEDWSGISFVDQHGQPLLGDPFEGGELYRTVACVSGQPGSGKTIFLKELVTWFLSQGGKAVVLDIGGFYTHMRYSWIQMCSLLGGKHIEFGRSSTLSLNPFTHIPTGNSPDDVRSRNEVLELVRMVFQNMASPQKGTTPLETFFIEEALAYSWERYERQGNVDTVREHLIQRHHSVADALSDKLLPYSSQGFCGDYFKESTNSPLKDDLTVIEIAIAPFEMIAVQLLILNVCQAMAKENSKRPFLIVIDEAWKLLDEKGSGEFIQAMRIANRHKGRIVCSTQRLIRGEK